MTNVWDPLAGSRSAAALAAQIAADQVAHAWLLLGPSGSGKGAAARAMASAINCSVQPLVGCGSCSVCARISRDSHPDVHRIAPEGPLIPIDVIRESVIPEAARSPFEARWKVFVIEEADRMSPAAQSVLLKTLEEPQPDTVFILISGEEDELLDTIRSRCRVIRLEPVPEQRTVELLTSEGASDEHALLAARLSDGDLARARALALDEAAAERRALWMTVVDRLFSPVEALDAAAEILEEAKAAGKRLETLQKEEVVELAEATGEARGTAAARNALAKRHKREVRRLEEEVLGDALQALASFYRDVLAFRRGGAEAIVNIDLLEKIETWAASAISDGGLVSAVERCIETRGALPLNANQSLALEATLVELARLVPAPAADPAVW
ncbi:MAG TPA: DNA polymerase III subunit delta' [Actinomycetota bacterium]|jgi:DNA polymerase-3 subunit delta'